MDHIFVGTDSVPKCMPADALLGAILNSSYDGLVVIDRKGFPILVNKAFERITGISRNDMMDGDVFHLVVKGLFRRSACAEALKTKETVTIRSRLKSGRVALVTARPYLDEAGEVRFVVANVRDITELNLIRQQLEKCGETDKEGFDERDTLEYELEGEKGWYTDFVARSKKMKELFSRISKVARFDTSVFVYGESGVGKKLVAKIIHQMSSRKEKPFVEINGAAIPEQLLESELFGYEKGAFTGANSQGKRGLLEVADGGTIFFDEISGMPRNLQFKMLTVLDEMEFTRVGGLEKIRADIRLIAATNSTPLELVENSAFREDLLYRLDMFPIRVPPLRERKRDIPDLTDLCIRRLNQKYNLSKRLSPGAACLLQDYDYPGNVRELRNIVERMIVGADADEIGEEYIPAEVLAGLSPDILKEKASEQKKGMSLRERVKSFEEKLIFETVQTHGSTHKAAKILGVNQSTVVRKIQQYRRRDDKTSDAFLHQ